MEPDAGDPRGSRVGDYALSSGIVAGVTTFTPVIGELLALPAAALAIGLGVVGVRRYETGGSRRFVPALVGFFLGALAALAAVMVFASTRLPL